MHVEWLVIRLLVEWPLEITTNSNGSQCFSYYFHCCYWLLLFFSLVKMQIQQHFSHTKTIKSNHLRTFCVRFQRFTFYFAHLPFDCYFFLIFDFRGDCSCFFRGVSGYFCALLYEFTLLISCSIKRRKKKILK